MPLYIAIPFGWGRSVLCFTNLMRLIVKYLRKRCGFRMLPYIEDLLVAASTPGLEVTETDDYRELLMI